MRRLDGVSAFMIYNDLPRCYQHTLKIAVLDFGQSPERYSYEACLESIKTWVDQFQILRWKLAFVPFGINHPVWVNDSEFDIRNHVTRIACPSPGDTRTFDELVSQLYSQTLDKNRPLWKAWVVEGMEDGSVNIVACLHHGYTDGIGAGKLLMGYAETPNTETEMLKEHPAISDDRISRFELLFRGLVDLPFMFFREIPPLINAIRRARKLEKQHIRSGGKAPVTAKQAPDSPFNSAHSFGRTFAHRSFELHAVKRVSRAFDVTINDLLVACIAGGVRGHYKQTGYSPDQPLVANIPLDVRTDREQNEILGNCVSNSFMWLPIHIADPLQRLTAVRESANMMKAHNEATGGSPFLGIAGLLHGATFKLLNFVVRRSDGQLKILGNITISNVRGPDQALNLGGGKIANILSIGQVTAGVGVNVTAWSFNGKFNICLMADAKNISDGQAFLNHIDKAYTEFCELALSAGTPL